MKTEIDRAIETWKKKFPFKTRYECVDISKQNYAKCFFCGEYFKRKTSASIVCSETCIKSVHSIRCKQKRQLREPQKYTHFLDMSKRENEWKFEPYA